MRCCCCNRNLTDYESALKHPETNQYLDICLKCLEDIPIVPIAPANAKQDVGYEDDVFDELEEGFELDDSDNS